MAHHTESSKSSRPILIIGGAGYIGSHCARLLAEKGYAVEIVDNLSTGHRASNLLELPFYEIDIRQEEQLVTVLKFIRPEIIFHFAASSLVPESVTSPLKYVDNNIVGMKSILRAMNRCQIHKVIFSSTAAVYGEPKETPISDSCPVNPINAYGETKLFIERLLNYCSSAYGISSVSLRYFNACGAYGDGAMGEWHTPETHLIPIVLQSILGKRELYVFGADYPTDDGSAIRDYIHVLDLARAHLAAMHYLDKNSGAFSFNLGNGKGFSVFEVIRAAEQVTGKCISYTVADRRPGDPAVLVANYENAREILGWRPQFNSLEDMIRSAWDWHRTHPDGYENQAK